MSAAKVPDSVRRRIAVQAEYRCGYCLTSERLTGIRLSFDHIIPLAASGLTEEVNLWVACRSCNEFKGIQTHAQDPITGQTVPLFNPRVQMWHEHFEWSANRSHIIGLTPVGRAAVVALQLNHDFIVHARRQWAKVGWHPPE
jgi:hypothetical protein